MHIFSEIGKLEERISETESYPVNKFFPVINRIKHSQNYFMQLVSFHTPWNQKKPEIFPCFQGIYKKTSAMNWVNRYSWSEATLHSYSKEQLFNFFLKFCTVTLSVHFNVLLALFRAGLKYYIYLWICGALWLRCI